MRLELCVGFPYKDKSRYFNSIKVRLEHAAAEKAAQIAKNFNSIKVRLERTTLADDNVSE